jgi:hypothetical protein
VVNANVVGNDSLYQWQNCPSYNGHVQDARATACQRTEFRLSQAKDGVGN